LNNAEEVMDHGVVDLDPDRIQPGTREGREVLAHDVAQGSQWERGAMDARAQAAEAEKEILAGKKVEGVFR